MQGEFISISLTSKDYSQISRRFPIIPPFKISTYNELPSIADANAHFRSGVLQRPRLLVQEFCIHVLAKDIVKFLKFFGLPGISHLAITSLHWSKVYPTLLVVARRSRSKWSSNSGRFSMTTEISITELCRSGLDARSFHPLLGQDEHYFLQIDDMPFI